MEAIKLLTPDEAQKTKKEIPKEMLDVIYDTDDNVLFGSRYTKGKVTYTYVKAEYMSTNRPYIIYVGIAYDGKGNADLPEGAVKMAFKDLPTMFPDNEFT